MSSDNSKRPFSPWNGAPKAKRAVLVIVVLMLIAAAGLIALSAIVGSAGNGLARVQGVAAHTLPH